MNYRDGEESQLQHCSGSHTKPLLSPGQEPPSMAGMRLCVLGMCKAPLTL